MQGYLYISCQTKKYTMQQQKSGYNETVTQCLWIKLWLWKEYIGETKKRVLTRSIENQDSMTGKWEESGATEHPKDCHGRFNWLHPKNVWKTAQHTRT